MKTKIYTILFFALTLLSALIFNSCKRPESNCAYNHTTDITRNLSDYNKINYYKGNDTLIFISDVGDTAILYGQGKKIYFDVTTSGNGNTADCGSMPQYTYHNENLDLTFLGNNSELYKIVDQGYFDNIGEEKNLTVNNFTSSYGSVTKKITIKGIDYDCYYSKIPPYTYFNFQYGILRIDSINGKNWTLSK